METTLYEVRVPRDIIKDDGLRHDGRQRQLEETREVYEGTSGSCMRTSHSGCLLLWKIVGHRLVRDSRIRLDDALFVTGHRLCSRTVISMASISWYHSSSMGTQSHMLDFPSRYARRAQSKRVRDLVTADWYNTVSFKCSLNPIYTGTLSLTSAAAAQPACSITPAAARHAYTGPTDIYLSDDQSIRSFKSIGLAMLSEDTRLAG